MKMNSKFDFIIVGGGIAGTTCAQRLTSLVDKESKILLLSATQLVKSVTNIKTVTKFLSTFDIVEKSPDTFTESNLNLTILQKFVIDLDSENHKVVCNDGTCFEYKKLCICTGGKPKLLYENNLHVLGIRDTETVLDFQAKLKDAKKVIIVGNGGIATELVYEIDKCDIIWVIKDSHISHTFFDAHSAKFFEKALNEPKKQTNLALDSKRTKYLVSKLDMSLEENKQKVYGSALGPDWSFDLPIKGAGESRKVLIEYNSEIKRIIDKLDFNNEQEWPVNVELTNNKIIGCDFIISATGVVPAVEVFTKNNNFELGKDGGLLVNDKMETSIKDIYAVGDACTAGWNLAEHWFQMRLWSQARQMADYAARSMWASVKNEPIELDFCFEMFAHITNFFNYKVILLGNYDAKGLGNEYELLLRCTQGVEYVKIVVYKGKVQGALFIGDTDLEETFENLILNQIDVSQYGEDLINPDIDIEDYFD